MKEKEKRVVSIFEALGSPIRYKMIKLLADGEMCTSKLAEALGKDKSTVSKHLKILKDLDIVRFVTKEKYVYYRLKKSDILKLLEFAEKIFGRE